MWVVLTERAMWTWSKKPTTIFTCIQQHPANAGKLPVHAGRNKEIKGKDNNVVIESDIFIAIHADLVLMQQ